MTKLSPSGNSLVYSTYLGGDSDDFGNGIALDGSGSAYVTGYAWSTDFPTQNPYQTDQPERRRFRDEALALREQPLVLDLPGRQLVKTWASASPWTARASAYLTGYTGSTDFPTQNPFQTTTHSALHAFVTGLSPSGSSLKYSTYLGGNGFEVGLQHRRGRLGERIRHWLHHFDGLPDPEPHPNGPSRPGRFRDEALPSGNSLLYSTYLGGNGIQDEGFGIALDGSGSAYVTGQTDSTDFPTQNSYQTDRPDFDAFVTKLRFSMPFSLWRPVGSSTRGTRWVRTEVPRWRQARIGPSPWPDSAASPQRRGRSR